MKKKIDSASYQENYIILIKNNNQKTIGIITQNGQDQQTPRFSCILNPIQRLEKLKDISFNKNQ